MGREVRRVPANWQHPQDGRGYIPLLGGSFAKELAEWDEGSARWDAGFIRDYSKGLDVVAWKPRDADTVSDTYAEYSGDRPDADEYMPDWPESERTHLQMYEDTTEGTPISPVMATPEELARWLADNNANAFAGQTASYESWLATIKRGWAPSAVSVDGGPLVSGVSAMETA
jgi:hypothetical protein